MRKLAAGVFALPTVAMIYARSLARGSIAGRMAIALGLTALGVVGVFGFFASGSAAQPPTPVQPVAAGLFSPVLTNQALDAPITVKFTTAMDRASVAAALAVVPQTNVKLGWDAAGRVLTVTPATNWAAATDYTVTVARTARDRRGSKLGSPARAIFLTRAATTGQLTATLNKAGLLPATGSIELTFDRPVVTATVRSALALQPAAGGTIASTGGSQTSTTFMFTPSAPLTGGTSFTVALAAGVVDQDGGTVAPVAPLTFKTVPAPLVVRSRPSGGTAGVDGGALLSVRFSLPMDPASTASAFSVTRKGASVAGKLSWSEHGTVLAFDPAKRLPAGTTLKMSITRDARSAEGAALAQPLGVLFTVAKPPPPPTAVTKPKAPVTKPAVKPAPKPAPTPPPPSGGAAAGSAPWHAVETYFLGLLNCTRTGSWITSGGSCGATPSSLTVRPPAPPLALDAGISDKVSRPYAQYLALHNLCNHFYDGSPGDRLARAGYRSYRWGENIGCPSGNPNAGMIAVERFFQNETPSGGHYVNLMNPLYDRAGIGVWVYAGRVRVVIDFYRP